MPTGIESPHSPGLRQGTHSKDTSLPASMKHGFILLDLDLDRTEPVPATHVMDAVHAVPGFVIPGQDNATLGDVAKPAGG